MLLGYPLPWRLCLPHRKPGSSGRDRLQFSHPVPRSPRHLWVGVTTAWVQHPLPRWGCLHLSSLQDRDSESWAWGGQTTVFVPHVLSWLCWIMCWNTGADIREGQALLSSTSCTRPDQGSWLQQMFLLFKVVGTFLVLFLPSSCPHASPIWPDV